MSKTLLVNLQPTYHEKNTPVAIPKSQTLALDAHTGLRHKPVAPPSNLCALCLTAAERATAVHAANRCRYDCRGQSGLHRALRRQQRYTRAQGFIAGSPVGPWHPRR